MAQNTSGDPGFSWVVDSGVADVVSIDLGATMLARGIELERPYVMLVSARRS